MLLLVLLLLLRAPSAVIALAITAITENVCVRISVIAVIADLAITRAITVTSVRGDRRERAVSGDDARESPADEVHGECGARGHAAELGRGAPHH